MASNMAARKFGPGEIVMVSSVMVVAPLRRIPYFRLRCSFARRKIVDFLPARVLNPAPAYTTFSWFRAWYRAWFRACFGFFPYDKPRRSSALKSADPVAMGTGSEVSRPMRLSSSTKASTLRPSRVIDMLAQRCAAEIGRANTPAISIHPFRDPEAEDPLSGVGLCGLRTLVCG